MYALLFLGVPAARANIPGGGTGAGANVTMAVSTSGGVPSTVTLDNGIVNAVIKVSSGQLLKLTYNGVQFTDGYTSSANGCFYWQGRSDGSDTLLIVKDPATNGGDLAEISLENPAGTTDSNVDAHRHFVMKRGSPGIYVTQILTRNSSAAAGGVSIPSLTGKLTASQVLNWLAQDGTDPRSQLMPVDTTIYASSISDSPKEVSQMLDGILAGQFDCKYNYSGDLGTLTTTGWCSTAGTAGVWIIHPSNEYFTNGPMHREILAQMKIVQSTFTGVHFGFNPDVNFSAGETWSRVCGPFFIYANKAPGTSNPPAAMFADAQAQAQAERSAWPYSWFSDSNYAQASGRGTVTGKIVINDAFNPNASATGLWVGVARQPASPTSPLPTDFQLWGKDYQYWVKTDGAGNFTIPNVVAGSNYTLFAYGPGSNGLFQSQVLSGATPVFKIDYPASPFAVTVTGGQTTALGTVTWIPARPGPTVFEIGVPDRNTQEFRHGDDYWHGEMGTAAAPAQFWAPFQLFPYEWPSGLNYTVGQSHWATDWDYAQPTIFNQADGTYGSNSWTVTFNLPSAPTAGVSASLYLGLASANSSPVVVSVNGTNLGGTSGVTAIPASISSTGFFPAYGDSSVVFRMASHGIFCDERLTFPASLLKAGTNTITLNMRKGGYFANAVQYDYVRLEVPGYVPPAPASLTALAGSGAVQLRWPAAPGATSYKVLRSVTAGSGYTPVASGVIGPVSGSTPDTVSYTDATAANGTAYYYVVQSVNPAGTSGNSAQAAATPSATAPAAPAAPTGLAATSGNMQVALNWNASANAAYYVVKRSLTSGGPYPVIGDTVKTNAYTDLGRSNGMTYYYVVDAANASGTSADSNEAASRPLPPTLTLAPSNLTVGNDGGSIDLTWTPVANATGYALQRATAAAGPYITLTTSQSAASFTDATAAGNTTYYYQVAASNLAGAAAYSAPVSILTPPDAPATLTATGASSRVTLNWSSSTGATGYTIARSTASGGSYTIIASNLADTTYIDRTVANGTAYYYVVAAIGAGGTGAVSTEASATPIGVATLTWTGSVSGTWDTSTSNWLNGGTAAAYVNGQAAFFDDTASKYTVTLSGALSPDNVNFNAANAYTFAAAGLSGATSLTKAGAGALTVSGINTFTGGTYILGGSVVLGGNVSGNAQNGLGTGPITLQGGTLVMNGYTGSTTPNYGALGNDLKIPAGSTGTLDFTPRGSFGGAVTGGGTLTLAVNYVRGDIGGDWSAFTGQINVVRYHTGTTVDNFRIASNTGFGTAAVNLAAYVTALTTLNASNTFTVGQLSGDASARLTGVSPASGTVGSFTATYAVGGRNTDATFAGSIANGNSPSVTAITKEGSGTWTLSGASAYTGATLVKSGTLNVTGTVSGTTGLAVNGGGTLLLNGGAISVNGPVTNGGTIRLTAAASLATTGTFTNNGVLDLINGPQMLPANFVNNGVVLTGAGAVSSVTRAASGTCTLVVPGYAGHTYQLQSTPSLTAPNWQNIGGSQAVPGTRSGAVPITLVDSAASGDAMFYRVIVTASP